LVKRIKLIIVDCWKKHDEVHLKIRDEEGEHEIVFPSILRREEIIELLKQHYKRRLAPVEKDETFKPGEALELEV